MKAFRGKDWIKGLFKRKQHKPPKIQSQDLNAKAIEKQVIRNVFKWLNTYKSQCLKGIGAVGLLAVVTIGGNQYVKANTNEVFHVFVNKKEAGVVSNPEVVEKFVIEKYKQVQDENPNAHMVLNSDQVHYKSEKAFKVKSNNGAALKKLNQMLVAKAYGVELKVDGKVVAVVKDKETANQILNQIKQKYVPSKAGAGQVAVLSANQDQVSHKTNLESVSFTQNVQVETKEIDPKHILNAGEVVRKLITGDVKPTKYTVQEGDCVSCVAQKFNISIQQIYDNNPWIVDDMIKIGDELDLTVLQPTLSVKTVEKLIEDQEIEYETEYRKDPKLLAGQSRVIKAGKNGLKKVTYQLTKINGQVMKEDIVDEVTVMQPVDAIAVRGTRVILGEGSGRFAWPVVGARLTSSYGMRWGRMHKGVDLIGSNRNILAADNGKVIFAGVKNGYGNVVVIDHRNGYETLYGHLSKISVQEGSIVEKGQKIGVMGNTGDSHGVHLHFEVHKSGSVQNPMRYLRR